MKILSKEVASVGWDNIPYLYTVMIDHEDGKPPIKTIMTLYSLRKREIEIEICSKGIDKSIVFELEEICWKEGQESTYED